MDAAKALLKLAIEEEPLNATLYRNLALLYEDEGDHEHAIETYRASTDLGVADLLSQVASVFALFGSLLTEEAGRGTRF